MTIWLLSLIFLPGTIIHEFSHALTAHLLFVHVGHMELMPRHEGESLKLGSVQVGKADPIRNFFIGVAPFFVGTALILAVLWFAFSNQILGFNIFTFVILLFTFIISNTMYSSRKDMEGAIEFFILVAVPIVVLYLLGVRIPGLSWDLLNNVKVEEFFKMSVIFLMIPITIDVALILFSKIVVKR